MANNVVLSVNNEAFSWEGPRVASFQVHPETIRNCVKQTLRNLRRLKKWDAATKAKTAKYTKITIFDDTVPFSATAALSAMNENVIARFESILARV